MTNSAKRRGSIHLRMAIGGLALALLLVNPRRSPGWILSNHAEDESPNLFAHTFSSSPLSSSGEPFPIQPKAGPMPTYDRSRCAQDERFFPSGPELS